MNNDHLWEKVEKTIEEFSEEAIQLSDYLAQNPELSGEEQTSSRLHVEFLRRAGYQVDYPFMGLPTAFVSRAGASKGPKVSLLFEYDALPDIGHACGHNVSGAMSGLAAVGLSRVIEEIPGELLLVGTPSEETNGAKVKMAEEGLFDDVDLAMMIHCNDQDTYVGYRSLAMDAMEFSFKGKPAHAAGEPWAGLNALNAVQLLFHGIDMLRQHVTPDVRMHGIVSKGGLAPNIVPENCSARFYFRAKKRGNLNTVVEKALNCAKGAALATGTTLDWHNFEFSFDDMLDNPVAETEFESIFRSLGLSPVETPGAKGSSDVGNVSYRCPAVQPKLSITDEKMALHTHEFAKATVSEKAHRALIIGAKALSKAALEIWFNDELRKKIREDFEKRKG